MVACLSEPYVHCLSAKFATVWFGGLRSATLDAAEPAEILKRRLLFGEYFPRQGSYRPMAKKHLLHNKNEGCLTIPFVTGVKSAREHWSPTCTFRRAFR
jgi:hypothetical protein